MKSRLNALLVLGLFVALLGTALTLNAQESPSASEPAIGVNLLRNPSFEDSTEPNGVPTGWQLYGALDERRRLALEKGGYESERALRLEDGDDGHEIGITQAVPIKGGYPYVVSVRARLAEGGACSGSYVQLRFLPSNEFEQAPLFATDADTFVEAAAGAIAPEGATHARVYVYTHRDPTPHVIIDDVRFTREAELPAKLGLSKPTPPTIESLKELYLDTVLVRDGKANAVIVAPASGLYQGEAAAIAEAIKDATGADLPILADDAPEADIPMNGNVIVLGNRSTNALIGALYDRFYTLLDLRYPGPSGHVVRTLHNPFGTGANCVLVGGSDANGVSAAVEVLAEQVRERGAEGSLSLPRTALIKLGDGIEPPKDAPEAKIWEASSGYRSTGYFGWNTISKHMALYYMTGNEHHAKEFLRLAFPDEQALKEITEIDGERIEDKPIPLSGPYHYNAHMMILFWDLIEESPVFSDEDRLRVTQAFANQLNHHGINSAYVGPHMGQPSHVGSRHGQWTAISLYCLGRYFAKDYDHPVWDVCEDNGARHFRSLHEHAWVSGENDNLYWYSTAIAPIFTYLVLTGDRVPLENGVVAELLRGQEILASGRVPDWAINYASMGFLHKAAYVTQDPRWLEYRDRTRMDLDGFRVGQSFWPEEDLAPAQPDDLVGKWSVQSLPKPMWTWRQNGFAQEESFLFMSARTRTDAGGDYILLDGFNGASRNPYHAFAILELRLDGNTILQGYRNQVRTTVDGMVERDVAMDAALKHRDVLGETLTATAEVPDAPFARWRRSLVQRAGRYALLVDAITPRADSENLEVQLLYENQNGKWRPGPGDGNRFHLENTADLKEPATGLKAFRSIEAECRADSDAPNAMAKHGGYDMTLRRAKEVGAWLEMPFELDEEVSGEVFAHLLNYRDRGVVRLELDGETVVDRYVHHTADPTPVKVSLGNHTLAEGPHRLRVVVIETQPEAGSCYIALIGISLGSGNAPNKRVPTICVADELNILESGPVLTGAHTGPAKVGAKQHFFSLVGFDREMGAKIECVRLAQNAAALTLPEAAVVVAGHYEGVQGDLVVVAEDHLYGRSLKQVAGLLTADAPCDVDWDLATGVVHVLTNQATRLGLAVRKGAVIQVEGAQGTKRTKRTEGTERTEEGEVVVIIAEGRSRIEGAFAGDAQQEQIRAFLGEALKTAKERLGTGEQGGAAVAEEGAAPIAVRASVEIGGAVTDLEVVVSEEGDVVCAAEGKTVHVIAADGSIVRTMNTDGTIRMLHWWPEHRLLLAGCNDEKVIAFDEAGRRVWEFVSEMDPAVFKAAKTYWFKSEPGHEGIHGLDTGVFLDGKSQAFVGSACTLEIIDEKGQLVVRMPQFWGKVSTFRLIDGADGSLNLLAARKYNGTNTLGVINNKTLSSGRRSFYSVPPGHTHMPGWSAMNRHHIFYDDFDGDGVKDVMSEINGRWNRVTVWDTGGTGKYDVSFGPGPSIHVKTMRDIDVADFDGDGAKEIVVGTSRGMLVALTGTCEKVWAKRLASPLTVLQCVASDADGAPRIVAGCEDGTVEVRDVEGRLLQRGSVAGTPTKIEALRDKEEGVLVAIGTETGQVSLFGGGE